MSMLRRCGLTSLVLLALAWGAASPCLGQGAGAPPSGERRIQDPARAREYMDWALALTDKLEADIASYSKAADVAAGPFLEDKPVGVRGSLGLVEELGGRAGGFIGFRGSPGKPGNLIIYAFGTTTTASPDARRLLAKEIDDAGKHKAGGSTVIGIASLAQLKALGVEESVRNVVDALVDNHAGAEDGLFLDAAAPPRATMPAATTRADPRRVAPTFVVAQAAAAWVLSAELFAACTRRGQTPAMYQSIMVPKAEAWNQPLLKKRFHDDGLKCPPIEPGRLGKEYLRGLRGVLRDVSTASWPQVMEACDRLAGVIGDGGEVYIGAFGHYPYHHHAGRLLSDPGIAKRLNDGQKMVGRPGLADAALVIGYCLPPDGQVMGNYLYGDPEVARGAGRGVVWVLTGYLLKPGDFKRGELLVDQRWGEGDAVVSPPGYPIRVFPTSGVVAQTLMWAMQAQVAQQAALERASRKVK